MANPNDDIGISDRVALLMDEGERIVAVDAPIGVDGLATEIAARLAPKGNGMLLVLESGSAATRARFSLADHHPRLRVGTLEENCDIAIATWEQVSARTDWALASRYSGYVLGERPVEHVVVADALSRAILKSGSRRLVDIQGRSPRLELGGARLWLDVRGKVHFQRKQEDDIDVIGRSIAMLDKGRKDHGILVDRAVVPATLSEMMMWGLRNGGVSVPVSVDEMPNGDIVSTVFVSGPLGRGSRPPALFETLVSSTDGGDVLERYETWEEAEIGHARLVASRTGPTP